MNGASPPEIVSVTATPLEVTTVLGSTTSGGGGVTAFGWTVTLTVALWPTESWMVTTTLTSTVTVVGTRLTIEPGTFWVTGSTAVLLENARYGGTPPETVSCVPIVEYTSTGDGSTTSGGGGETGPGRMVTCELIEVPAESWIVIVANVVLLTLPANSVIVFPGSDCGTGKSAELLENARYGATPPEMVSVAATCP